MRFLANENFPADAVDALRQVGHDLTSHPISPTPRTKPQTSGSPLDTRNFGRYLLGFKRKIQTSPRV